jgi:hypothetical protein
LAPLDRWLPEFDVREYHEAEVAASPQEALRVLLATPAAPDQLVRKLFRLRRIRGAEGTLEELFEHGFLVLERTPTLFLAGAIAGVRGEHRGQPQPGDAGRWLSFAAPGAVKIALEFHAEELPGGRSLLATETRVLALDARARRAFKGYWLFVGPFSGLIRKRWLAAARAQISQAPLS